jgi:uncharacterized protein YdeI (YjbR/CyaY-like superfamily)
VSTHIQPCRRGNVEPAFLNRIQTAVRPETRTRRIEQLTDALAQGKTPYPAPTKKSGI